METFRDTIKFNCEVSDARFWGHFSICGLLLRYRDLFRSEQGLDPWSPVPRGEATAWIARKEARWPELEEKPFRDLQVRNRTFSPFDSSGVSEALADEGLAYGAGYGMYLKPTFFLARVRSREVVSGHTVITTDREIVRDLFSAPAMLQERTVYLRLEPLRSLLWDKYTELGSRCPPALSDAFSAYGLGPGRTADPAFAADLDRIALDYASVLLRHELAESAEAATGWKEVLAGAADRKAEHFLRAVNDLVADTSPEGPVIDVIRRRDRGALGLSLGLMDGYRRLLFPELKTAYDLFREKGGWELLEDACRIGHTRFLELRRQILEMGARDRDPAVFRKALGDLMRSYE